MKNVPQEKKEKGKRRRNRALRRMQRELPLWEGMKAKSLKTIIELGSTFPRF